MDLIDMSFGRYLFVFMYLSGIGVCSDFDPEMMPLLAHAQSSNNDNNSVNRDPSFPNSRFDPLEVVIDPCGNECPVLMSSRFEYTTFLGLDAPIWNKILYEFSLHDLLIMRLVHPFFHKHLTREGNTGHPLGVEMLLNLADTRFEASLANEGKSLAEIVQSTQDIVRALKNTVLILRYQDRLNTHCIQLWRLRYANGMDHNVCRMLMEDLELKIDDSWRSWVEAKLLTSSYVSRGKGFLAESAKALVLLGTSAATLWATWSRLFIPSNSCLVIYALPSHFLEGNIIQIETRDLQLRILGSMAVFGAITTYGFTLLKRTLTDRGPKYTFKFRDWGKMPSFSEWVTIIEERYSPRVIQDKKMALAFTIPLLASTLLTSSMLSYLIPTVKTTLTSEFTIAHYIHEELKHTLHKNVSCCSIALDRLIGGSCPYVDPNKVQNFGELVYSGALVNGYTGIDIVGLSVIIFQTLFVMVLTALNFL